MAGVISGLNHICIHHRLAQDEIIIANTRFWQINNIEYVSNNNNIHATLLNSSIEPCHIVACVSEQAHSV